ncbi:hypothetical protein JL722_4133 [Aureococcus anophagefferens]|nr:hypothetical protein JL722_4133 [Aureococcus anophagefferens]
MGRPAGTQEAAEACSPDGASACSPDAASDASLVEAALGSPAVFGLFRAFCCGPAARPPRAWAFVNAWALLEELRSLPECGAGGGREARARAAPVAAALVDLLGQWAAAPPPRAGRERAPFFGFGSRAMRGCRATRVILDDANAAVAVEVAFDGRAARVAARREVLLAAGAVHSPQLLLLSGVGDAAALAKVGVAPRVHLPNVGRNLRDFAGTGLVVRARDDGWDRRSQSLAGLAAYGAAGAGPLSATSQEVQCFHGGGGGAAPKYEFFYQAMAFPFAHRTSYDDHVAAVRAGALPRAFTVHCCL